GDDRLADEQPTARDRAHEEITEGAPGRVAGDRVAGECPRDHHEQETAPCTEHCGRYEEPALLRGPEQALARVVATAAMTVRVDRDDDQRREPDEQEDDDERAHPVRGLHELGADERDHDGTSAGAGRERAASPAARMSRNASSRRCVAMIVSSRSPAPTSSAAMSARVTSR